MREESDEWSRKVDQAMIRAVIRELAPLQRLPASAGEARAADLIRSRLSALGWDCAVEPAPAYRSYAWPIGLLSLAAILSAGAGRRGHPRIAALGALLAAAGIVDDISLGPMVARRLTMRRRRTQNVVGRQAGSGAGCTLCVIAHHDAAPSGVVFAQPVERWLARRYPQVIERMSGNPPMWWLVLAGPGLVSLGGLLSSRRLMGAGAFLGAGSLLAMLDIGHRPAVPGANDNLSGVAVLVAIAEHLGSELPGRLRVVLASLGAEEALQQGAREFIRRHLSEFPRDLTYFLIVDTVGFGRLVLLEAEGPVRLRRYDESFKNLVEECARSEGIDIIRGLHARSSTDGTVPERRGYPTVAVVSVDEHGLMPHYHRYTDTPENVDYGCVERATRLVLAVARRLAECPAGGPATLHNPASRS
jgi:hypothetical protein